MRPFLSFEHTMTKYALREDLSFCEAGGRLVFLDIASDRYLRLPPALETTLVEYLSSVSPADIDITELVRRNILVPRPPGWQSSRHPAEAPRRSALEIPLQVRPIRISEVFEIFAIVFHTRLKLKLRPFREVIDILAEGKHNVQTQTSTIHEDEHRIIDAAAVFRRVRLYIPVGMRCLVDSVAMARFLRRRSLHTHVVFGVAVDPFSAHCWVQAGDLVLNDTLGNVTSHIPIRVV